MICNTYNRKKTGISGAEVIRVFKNTRSDQQVSPEQVMSEERRITL